MIKLSQKANSIENNFTFIRFLAATFVIFSHSFPLFGLVEPLISNYYNFSNLGVYIFFVISGFLITKSWSRSPEVIIFFQKRILRIFPGLIGTVLFGVFILGPLATTLSIREYFLDHQTWDFLKNIFLYPMQFNLPGVFENNPFPYSFNGPLWTLPIEFFMYVSIAFVGIIGLFKNKAFIPIIILPMIFFDWFILSKPDFQEIQRYIVFFQPIVSEFKLVLFFFMGSLFYIYSDKIYLDKKIAILAIIIFLLTFRTSYAYVVGYFILTYLIIYFVFCIDYNFFKNFDKYGDFSYGMYIYAFPIQQSLVYFGKNHLNFFSFFILAFSISLFFSFLSWNLVEKRAMEYKKVDIRQFFISLKDIYEKKT